MCKATHYDSSGKNGPLQKKEGTKVLSEHKYYVHTHHKDIK